MWFQIDQRSSTPLYAQIINGVKEAAAKGIITPGDKLPTVRELASSIMINPNTVAKAYQELEREGIIVTMRGRGTFLAAPGQRLSREEKAAAIAPFLEKLLVETHHLQMTESELLDMLTAGVRDWYEERRKQR